MEPDLHHSGPITRELTQDLMLQLSAAIEYLDTCKQDDSERPSCKKSWIKLLDCAGLHCGQITAKLIFGLPVYDEDRKCIDITLCILRDFGNAKKVNFLNPAERGPWTRSLS